MERQNGPDSKTEGLQPSTDERTAAPETFMGSLAQQMGGPLLQRKIQRRASRRHAGAGDNEAQAVQTKLSIGEASDPLEAEADSVADRVVAGTPFSARVSSAGSQGAQGKGAVAGMDTSVVESALSGSSGSPLPASSKAQLEPTFGQSLDSVRVHTGSQSARAAESIGAEAFASGNDIHFGAGRFNPGTAAGDHLLAHEVTHTVQQRGGGDVQRKVVQARFIQRDAVSDRRENHYTDPEMLSGDKTKAGVANKNWATKSTLFVDGVKPEDVIQGGINDCYLVAVLASIANQQPGYIQKIIREDSPGKFSVRFFEKDTGTGKYKQVWVAVDSWMPTETKGDGTETPIYGHSAKSNSDGKREMWPSVIEKAYAKFKGNYPDIDWGNTIYTYEALFGTEGTKQATNGGATAGDQDATFNQIKKAIDGGLPIVCSTGAHVISVLGYTDGGTKSVKVRDQAQASDDGTKTGVQDYPLAEFCTKFTYVRFANPEEVAYSSGGIHIAGSWTLDTFGEVRIDSQEKTQFTGTYKGGDTGTFPYLFQGGNSMVGRWRSAKNAEGGVSLTIADDKKTLTGTWGRGSSSTDGGSIKGQRK